MSYKESVLKDHPIAFWPLDNDAEDLTGRHGALNPIQGPFNFLPIPQIPNTQYSVAVQPINVAVINFPRDNGDSVNQSYTMEFVMYPAASSSMTPICHLTQPSGFSYNELPDTLTFSVLLENDTMQLLHQLNKKKSYHVVGVYSPGTASLYVDGQLVDTKTAENKNERFNPSVTDELIIGKGIGGSIAGVALYNYALTASEILRHYNALTGPVPETVPRLFGGTTIILDQRATSTEKEIIHSKSFGFGGEFTNVIVGQDGPVAAQDVTGLGLEGTWQTSYTNSPGSVLDSVEVSWEIEGYPYPEFSLDGGTWTEMENHSTLDLPYPYDTEDHTLDFRFRFTAGDNYGSVVKFFKIRSYATGDYGLPGRNQIRGFPSFLGEKFRPLDFDQDTGIKIDSTLTLKASTSDNPTGIKTLEFWYYGIMSTSFFGETYFLNGQESDDPISYEWSLMHIVTDSPENVDIVFDGNGTLGQIAIYDHEVTQEEALSIYKTYLGIPSLEVGDSTSVGIDTITPVLYSSNWSIQAIET